MSKLIIMRGLPASGKSTEAEALIKSMGNTVRINKDLLREMLHFNHFTGRNEGNTRDAARKLADWFLCHNINVIVDDTNLNDGTLQGWKDLGRIHKAKIEVIDINTTMDECLKRDSQREKQVGASVIQGMALQYGRYPITKKGFVLCDIDGTLADCSHRLHFLKQEPKDWKSFFSNIMSDTPRISTVDLLLKFEDDGYEIIFVSARPDNYRAFTEDWIVNVAFKGYKIYSTLLMRRGGDKRPDTEVKQQILDTYFPDKSLIRAVIDDRPSVIRMWKSNGLEVIDVGEGIEF